MKSIFKQLMEYESFREVGRTAAHSGQRINAGPWEVEVSGVPKAGEETGPVLKAIMTTGDFPVERTPLNAPPNGRKVFVKDLIPSVGLSTPSLNYSRITGWSASAGGVAQAANKPESGVITEVVLDTVENIATWMPYTRAALASNAGVAAFIQSIMYFFLKLGEDEAILNNNTANFKGLLNVAGIQTQALGADTRPDAIRKAITKVRTGIVGSGVNATVGFEPTALLVNPADGEKLELLKDSAGGYVLIPAVVAPWWESLQAQYWRVPVVETSAIAAGTGLVGAFDIGATLWPYGTVEVSITDSHSDLFVQNKVAIRIEVRELLATYIPKAFCKITGL